MYCNRLALLEYFPPVFFWASNVRSIYVLCPGGYWQVFKKSVYRKLRGEYQDLRILKTFETKKKASFCREESNLFVFLGIKVIFFTIIEILYQTDANVNLSVIIIIFICFVSQMLCLSNFIHFYFSLEEDTTYDNFRTKNLQI